MLAVFALSAAMAGLDPLKAAIGKWELDPVETQERGEFTCALTPLEISIDKTEMRYISYQNGESHPASILEVRETSFLIRYDDEERLDESGIPVEWWLVLGDENHFAWIRKGWPRGRTAMLRRCAPEAIS